MGPETGRAKWRGLAPLFPPTCSAVAAAGEYLDVPRKRLANLSLLQALNDLPGCSKALLHLAAIVLNQGGVNTVMVPVVAGRSWGITLEMAGRVESLRESSKPGGWKLSGARGPGGS